MVFFIIFKQIDDTVLFAGRHLIRLTGEGGGTQREEAGSLSKESWNSGGKLRHIVSNYKVIGWGHNNLFLQVEAGLKQSVKGVNEEIKKVTNNIENVASNETNLEAKMEKKKVNIS